jgi:hypothetical protein
LAHLTIPPSEVLKSETHRIIEESRYGDSNRVREDGRYAGETSSPLCKVWRHGDLIGHGIVDLLSELGSSLDRLQWSSALPGRSPPISPLCTGTGIARFFGEPEGRGRASLVSHVVVDLVGRYGEALLEDHDGGG